MDLIKTPARWRIYIITDERLSRGRSHEEIARAAIAGGADVIQLRDKTAPSRRFYEAAIRIRQMALEAGVVFIVNDRLDIAQACDADGLHVGQEDLPATVARRLLGPDKILGVSATCLEEAMQAEKDGADYLGVGPVFEARGTKFDAGEPLGLELVSSVSRRCSKPIVAIGGIKHDNAAQVLRAGADAVAVISAVVAVEDIAQSVRELRRVMRERGLE
jgi:thiamine-phosphate pyrophosphorylase